MNRCFVGILFRMNAGALWNQKANAVEVVADGCMVKWQRTSWVWLSDITVPFDQAHETVDGWIPLNVLKSLTYRDSEWEQNNANSLAQTIPKGPPSSRPTAGYAIGPILQAAYSQSSKVNGCCLSSVNKLWRHWRLNELHPSPWKASLKKTCRIEWAYVTDCSNIDIEIISS